MNYRIELGSSFKQGVKRLRKKYRSLDTDLAQLAVDLRSNPLLGVDLGNGVRKVRMAIGSKGRGKSHGARIITHTAIISVEEGTITLLAIYDKAEQNTITSNEISQLLQELEENR